MFYLRGFGCKATVTTEKLSWGIDLLSAVLSFQIEVRSAVRPSAVKNQCKKLRLPRPGGGGGGHDLAKFRVPMIHRFMTSHPVAELLLCFRSEHKDGRPMLFGFLVIFTHRLTELCILNADNIKKVYSRPIGVVPPPPTQAHKIQTKPSFAIEKVIYAAQIIFNWHLINIT